MNYHDIIQAVEVVTLVSYGEMRSRGRSRHVAEARHLAMYFMRRDCGMTLMKIGRIFDRDYSSVIHSVRMAEDLSRFDPDFAEKFEQCNIRIAGKRSRYSVIEMRANRVSPYVLPGLQNVQQRIS